ncbi:hypothetical protein ColTof4_10898 [Colletotrichum tofieldiae]|uniref:Ecp2 effector protein-like domain-containing protein n=1 Tax=Colletotrichum tofieldiae TaxID=708197 RepID=A0A166YNF9_9PEZI|nr:hypothetical protein CT0861_02731 [Colletotrichum tofieldiae]GKT59676.1 hypothetical protein ColTof3_07015 [Colletotrichum tofieldiae]GKT78475.1 hypothetical protein ColTof4_10898 [Colletotrichum tofieldiae]
MRKFFAPIVAFAAHAFARAVPDPGFLGTVTTISPHQEVLFKASNGSDVVFNIAAGLKITHDIRNLPWPVAKHIKAVETGELVELCTVHASQNDSGVNSPRRDDCQALFDYVKQTPALIYFEHLDSDTNHWAEIVWVGSCGFRTRTYNRDVVFSTGDIANFLHQSLSRPAWAVDGQNSATGEADCAVWSSPPASAPVFWRLQQRHPQNGTPLDNFLSGNETTRAVEIRQAESKKPLIVTSFDLIPNNTSAYVFNGTVHEAPDIVESANLTVSKRYEMYLGGNPEGPLCTPIWLSSDWDQPNTPLKSDCQQLLRFCQQNTAKVVFKERDLNFWAKFAAHESCGLSFMTTKEKIWITNRDMAGFLERAINYEPSTYQEIGVRAKMGVRCGFKNEKQYDGEFRLFYRDPSLPQGQIEQRDTSLYAPTVEAIESRDVSSLSSEFETLTHDDSAVDWVDFEFVDREGNNVTVQINSNALPVSLHDNKKVVGRLERFETPLGPSKRCTGKTTYMGGAGPDSALVEDCKKLRNFMSIRRFYFRWSQEDDRGPGQPLAKVDTCHLAWAAGDDVVVGNMDIDILMTNAIDKLDNTKGRMRGWGREYCDMADQYGIKSLTKWLIYP